MKKKLLHREGNKEEEEMLALLLSESAWKTKRFMSVFVLRKSLLFLENDFIHIHIGG
jgi:hypothetical protein